ncbi:MAG TPA: glycoside hydrolase family 2 TIM barrel-domain containing protein [Caulobacteraceae bacterium]|nr:glycoside hydrolase family 2 TIM barrel-domain containing protein [Caulobacteraceae bacterium]
MIACEAPPPAAARALQAPPRLRPFDDDWRFWRGDLAGGEAADLDDSGWRRLDLPHDWSIEDLPGNPARADDWAPPAALWNPVARPLPPGQWLAPQVLAEGPRGPPLKVGPFDAAASVTGFDSGWTVGGTGWYRKHFALPDLAPNSQVELRFDGAFMLADVWLNGAPLASHFNDFTPFVVDLTATLRPGDNVLAVRVRNEGKTARWYCGAGLYRGVGLAVTGPVRLPKDGVTVIVTEIAPGLARLEVSVEVENRTAGQPPCQVQIAVSGPDGRVLAGAGQAAVLEPDAVSVARLTLTLPDPILWSPDHPALYRLEAWVQAEGQPEDRDSVRFGVRAIALDAEAGLRINGEPVKLKGACLHHDNGLLGAVAIARAERRKVELLKAKGFNAVRCSHNAHSPALMDACDELGLLVIDEFFDAWETPKRADDYARYFADHWKDDLAAGVRRDRNRPSVILWSLGNEIPECATPRGVEIAAALRDAVRALDPSRPVTEALAPGVFGARAAAARQGLDVAGYNYMASVYEAERAADPGLIVVGTEQCAQFMHDAWRKVQAYPWVIGDFAWTGIDYIGEVGSGSSQLRGAGDVLPPERALTIFLWNYPAFVSGCGDLDLTGRPKPQSFYRDVLWGRSPLELLVQRPLPDGMVEQVGSWGWHDELKSWTWPQAEGQTLTVRAYSGGDEVRLSLNGREIGRRPLTPADKLKAEFAVPYAPGELIAVAFSQGREIGRQSLATAGPPARVRLTQEPGAVGRSRQDLAYVVAEVLDERGRLCPDAMVPLAFKVSGPAELAAAGSANPRGLESFRDPFCRTFHGVAQAIVRPTGRAGMVSVEVVATPLRGERLRIRLD